MGILQVLSDAFNHMLTLIVYVCCRRASSMHSGTSPLHPCTWALPGTRRRSLRRPSRRQHAGRQAQDCASPSWQTRCGARGPPGEPQARLARHDWLMHAHGHVEAPAGLQTSLRRACAKDSAEELLCMNC